MGRFESGVSISGYPELVKVLHSGQALPVAAAPGKKDELVCPAVVRDGNYYGLLKNGGYFGRGYLYQLTAAGKLNVIYQFTGRADGSGPSTPPVVGSDGNLYFFTDAGLLRYSASSGVLSFRSLPAWFRARRRLRAPRPEISTASRTPLLGLRLFASKPNGSAAEIYTGSYQQSAPYSPMAGLFVSGSNLAVLQPVEYTNTTCQLSGNFYAMPDHFRGRLGGAVLLSGRLERRGRIGQFYLLSGLVPRRRWVVLWHGRRDHSSRERGQARQLRQRLDGIRRRLSTAAAPIQMTLSKSHVLPGGSAQLTWQVKNAFSNTMQQCYGYGGLSGKVALSGTATVTAAETGSR